MPLAPGQVVQNRYRIVALLGQGGMGAVYRAWHLGLEVPVAIKEMVPQPGLDAAQLDRLREQFKREASVLLRLKQDNLVSVYDYFVEGGNTYLVMEFIEGESLAARIQRLGPLPEAEVLRYAHHLLDALAYCHSRRVIHRDIKPQNVLVRPEGDAVLVDFGLVKLWNPADPRTKTAIRGSGTPEYAPPEQYGGHQAHTGPHSDIYSLGATLYHALVGEAPPTVTERMLDPGSLKRPTAVRRDVSPRTEAAVLTALALQPGERYQSAEVMRQALDGGAGVAALRVRQGALRRVPVWGWVMGALAAMGLVAVGLGQLTNGSGARATPAPTSAPTWTLAPTATATPTPEPALALGSERTREVDGMVQVWVPAGSFEMGSQSNDPDAGDDEVPLHRVTLDGFWLDRTEVTNAQYEGCVEAGECEASGRADDNDFNGALQPVVSVTWFDAVAYCEWVGARLPTEAEWEYAARGPEGWVYPWGNTWEAGYANCDVDSCQDGHELTAPVGSFRNGAGWVGALDMAGNVWEWVNDWYGQYRSGAQMNPVGPESGYVRVLRGGSWNNDVRFVRSALRIRSDPTNTLFNFGFRCVSPQSP